MFILQFQYLNFPEFPNSLLVHSEVHKEALKKKKGLSKRLEFSCNN